MYTKRLENILAQLPRCNLLADVGCDHGYVGIAALQRNLAGSVVFVDISPQSLQKARQNCSDDLKMRAEFVCQDGLREICPDCAVIAGMGGLEIISVLTAAKQLPSYLVLQPMRNQYDVRFWLQSKYKITCDYKFFDGKFYDLLTAEKCQNGCKLTHDQLVFGKDNLTNPSEDFITFLKKSKREYTQILQQCNDTEVRQKYSDVCRVLAQITEEQQ